jgi:tRNA pseudouridine32 synthase/23S rRNA pseudouridine746 synthase
MISAIEQWLHYTDDDIVIVNKPSGIPTVPGKTPKYTANIYHLLQDFMPPVYVVHRLDINTSGMVIFARTKTAQVQLNRAFEQRTIAKYYLAKVQGQIQSTYGEISLPIITDWYNRPLQKLCFHHGKVSITQFETLEVDQANDTSLLLLKPITGRSHQLRIHCQLIGHPILGCKLYPNQHSNPPSIKQLQLHAWHLSFTHPTSEKTLNISCLPDFSDIDSEVFKQLQKRFPQTRS